MTDDLPPRVKAAEDRAQFRRMLDASSLGDPEAQACIARNRCESSALPDRWVSLSSTDLAFLLEMYRIHRETWGEDHDTSVARVLSQVDFELSQDDLRAGRE